MHEVVEVLRLLLVHGGGSVGGQAAADLVVQLGAKGTLQELQDHVLKLLGNWKRKNIYEKLQATKRVCQNRNACELKKKGAILIK